MISTESFHDSGKAKSICGQTSCPTRVFMLSIKRSFAGRQLNTPRKRYPLSVGDFSRGKIISFISACNNSLQQFVVAKVMPYRWKRFPAVEHLITRFCSYHVCHYPLMGFFYRNNDNHTGNNAYQSEHCSEHCREYGP